MMQPPLRGLDESLTPEPVCGLDDGAYLRLPGDPVTWARPRFNGGRGFTAAKQAAAKTDLSSAFLGWWARRKRIPKGEPISVTLTFCYKAPRKSLIGSPKTTRPDIDNLAKLVLDAGNGIIWEDDGQIAEILIAKRYAESPATEIRINPWPR